MDINIEIKELARLENTAQFAQCLSPADQEKLKYVFIGAALAKTACTDVEKAEQDARPDTN